MRRTKATRAALTGNVCELIDGYIANDPKYRRALIGQIIRGW